MDLYDYPGKREEMKIKGWPKDDSPADFEKLAKPLVNALRFAYEMNRKNTDKDIPWRGPDIGWRERATCPSPQNQLSAKNLTYSNDEQGRDALEEIIGIALRIGIEQGRRITMESSTIKTLCLELKMAKLGIELLSKEIEKNDTKG